MLGSFKLRPSFLRKHPSRSIFSIPSLARFYTVFSFACSNYAIIYYYNFRNRPSPSYTPLTPPFSALTPPSPSPSPFSALTSPPFSDLTYFLLTGADSTEPFSTCSSFSALLSRALRSRSIEPLGCRLKMSTNSIAIFLSLMLRRGVTMRLLSSWMVG